MKSWAGLYRVLLVLAATAGSVWYLYAADDLSRVPPPEGLVRKETTPAAAAVVCFLEGPAVDA